MCNLDPVFTRAEFTVSTKCKRQQVCDGVLLQQKRERKREELHGIVS